MTLPLVTAIVSTYAAERFIRGCLDDLIAQTIFAQMEVLVIDSGSPQNESAICAEYAQRHPQIRLVRTEREPLYVAWNRAIDLARGKYLTNANTDDRHHPKFAALMAEALERRPEVGLVYADQLISPTENETFGECAARNAAVRRWPDFTPEDLMLRCITGSQPMWRRSLHDRLGKFDTRYRIAADYDMWMRVAKAHELARLPQTLGVFYDAPNTLSGSNNRLATDSESLAIRKAHLSDPRWSQSPSLRKRLAKELFGVGYRYIERQNNGAAAAPFIREAMRLDPFNLNYVKTYMLRCMLIANSEAAAH